MKIGGKNALVTGAASGIGRAISEALVRRGAGGLVLVDLAPEAEEVARELETEGCRVRGYVGDTTDEGFRKEVLDEAGTVRIEKNHAFLESSRMFSWVEEGTASFAVGTSQGTATVKGTRFSVDRRDRDTTRLSVVEGIVVLGSDQGQVLVQANMQAVVKSGRAPEPAREARYSSIAFARSFNAEYRSPM